MKKFLIILGVIILVFVSTLIAIPLVFQSELQQLVLDEVHKTVDAKVEMEDFNLSLISNFPELTAEISGLKVLGMDEFDGVTLLNAQTILTTIDLQKLFNGDVEVNEIGLDGIKVNVIVLKNGLANYDIAKESDADSISVEEVEIDETDESSEFKMSLQRYFITNLDIVYDDQVGDMYMELLDVDHEGKGDFTLSEFILETTTSIQSISFTMGNETYLKKASFNSSINLAMDMDHFRFQFDTTFLQLNALILNIEGWLAMPNDSIDMDIALSTQNNTFKELFSLIPNAYIEDYSSVKVSGKMAMDAHFKGIYHEETLPSYAINLIVNNGNVKYPDLPATVENIGIDLHVNSPGGDLNRMVIDLKKAHIELADNYFDMKMLVKNSVSNPIMDGQLKMDFDLATIPTFMPVEDGEQYQGKMKADVQFKADVNSLDHEMYDKVEAGGTFEAWDIVYDDGTGGLPMNISHVNMEFDMNKVDLMAFNATLGKSDVQATGDLENFIPWYLNEATIRGNLNFHSDYFNVDEWMTEEESEGEAPSTTAEQDSVITDSTETYAIPTNVEFTMNSSMTKIDYDNMVIEDLKGTIVITHGKVKFKNAGIRMFEGTATMNGVFDPTSNPYKPVFDFKMGIHNWSINQVANTFNSIEKLAPVLKTARGTFSTKLHTEGVLDHNLEPILDKLHFSGVSTTKNLSIKSDGLEKLNNITKTKNFNPLKADDITFKYICSNGILETEPFDVKIGTQKAKVSGYTTLDQEINYIIDTKVKTSEMGAGADAVIGQIEGLLQSNGVKAKVPEEIPVVISVTGNVSDPTFKPVFGKGDQSDGVKTQVKEVVKEKIEEVKKDLKKEAQEEADKIMADAKKQQEQLMQEAKKHAEALKVESKKLGNQLRAEADKQAKELVKQASNPFAKIAAEKAGDELRKQADKKAKDLDQEADKQGKALIATAQKESDKILEDAKKRADEKIHEI